MRSILGLAVAAAAGLTALRSARAEETPPAPPPEVRLEFVYLELTGVEGAEADAVAAATTAVPGVRSFAWTVAAAEAKVVRVVGKADDATLLRTATASGAATAGVVPLAATKFVFETKLHCGGCVAQVNKALKAVRGVKESTVPKDMTSVRAVYDTRAVKPADIEAALAGIGKPAHAEGAPR